MNYKSFLTRFILSGCCIITFTTCKKYPENKFSEFVNPRKVLEGQWYFNGYFVNDADSTLQHLKVFNPNASNPNSITFNITESGSKKNEFSAKLEGIDFNYYDTGCACNWNIEWANQSLYFNNRKKEIYIGWVHNASNFFASTEKYGCWKIRKLTKKEFIIENELNKKYRVEFFK